MSKSQCNVNLMVFTIEVFGVRKPLKRLMEEAFFFFFFNSHKSLFDAN